MTRRFADLVSIRTRLAPLPVPDVRPYLNHRLAASGGDGERVFSRRSARELHAASRGVPGRIDAIASEAIRIARGTEAVAGRTRARAHRDRRDAAATSHCRAGRHEGGSAATGTARDATPAKPAAAVPAAPRPAAANAPARPTARTASPPSSSSAAAPAPRTSSPPAPPAAAEPAHAAAPAEPPQPDSPPLTSTHPRVKEWVSRFTDGEGVLRFGARMKLPPLTEPDALPEVPESPAPPTFDATPPASAVTTRRMEHTLRSEPSPPEGKPATPAPRAPEPVAFTPVAVPPPTPRASEPVIASEPEPIAFVPQPEDDAEPEAAQREPLQPQPEIVITPEPIVLDPALLEPVPLELDVPEPQPVAAAPAPPAPAPPYAPVAPPTVPAAAPAESSGSAKKRKRERERAARQAQQAGSSRTATTGPRATMAPAAAAPAAASAAPKRKLIIDESVLADAPAPPVAGPPPPASWHDGPRSPRHTSPIVQAAVPLLLMVGVASVAIFASTRTGFDRNHTRTQVSATTPAVPDSALAPPAPVTAKPQPVIEEKPSKFCLAVGTYLFSDRARLKAKQLARRTKMKTWVETTTSDGTRSYRIMIGGFATESEAERAADRLLARGLVGEAMVEPITESRRRR